MVVRARERVVGRRLVARRVEAKQAPAPGNKRLAQKSCGVTKWRNGRAICTPPDLMLQRRCSPGINASAGRRSKWNPYWPARPARADQRRYALSECYTDTFLSRG